MTAPEVPDTAGESFAERLHDEGGPLPLVAGTFAIYDDGGGGFVMVAHLADGETVRKHIPRAVVRLARRVIPGLDKGD